MFKKLISLLLFIIILTPYPSFAQQHNNLSVTATIPAQADDFTTTTELINPQPNTFPQNTILTYQITYGATLSNSVNFTLEANWSLGTIEGTDTPTVEIVDYVIGSASNAYGNTPPIIDTVNRKITWTISSFPADTTDQTVTFQLKTNSNYTGDATVDFDIASLIHGPGVDSATSTITNTYNYSPTPTPQPTPTSTPTPTATSGPSTSTPIPTPPITSPVVPFQFQTISVNEKTATTTTIGVTTNQSSQITILYGTRPRLLTDRISSNSLTTLHLLELSKLTPETTYYYTARATNNEGDTILSDIFTFTTAVESELPTINLETLVVTSQDKVILDGALAQSIGSSTVLVPKDFTIEVRFAVNKDARLKRIVLNVRPKNVLGINTFTSIEPPETGSTLIEIQKGIYYGRLKAGQVGTLLFARIEDENGNIVERKVADLKVLELMKILNTKSKKPIEGARVSLSFFNLKNGQFEFISPTSLAINNPSFSNTNGTVPVVLPPGRYQAKVEVFGYKTKTVEFKIGVGRNETYPLIELEEGPITLIGLLGFIAITTSDMFTGALVMLDSSPFSNRLAVLLHVLTFLFFIALLLFSISLHFSVHPLHLPQYVLYHALMFTRRAKHEHILNGVVVNRENGYGIEGVLVYVRGGKNKIIAHTITNSFGEFYIKVPKTPSYYLTTMHRSFIPSERHEVPPHEMEKSQKLYIEEKHYNAISHFLHQAGWYGGYVLSDIVELLLVATLILEALFLINIGLLPTLPFVVVSILNLLLLLYFRKHKEEAKVG